MSNRAPQTHHQIVQRLNGEIAKTLSPLTGSTAFALLDFPDHANVGNSAIWLGELAYFRGLGHSPAYVSRNNKIESEKLRKLNTIFLHGGGNFGDLWPRIQKRREDILHRFRGHKIIQLPQSVHFQSEVMLKRAAKAIAQHPDFILLLRDQQSLDLARRHFQCESHLCPDMAFALGELRKDGTSTRELLLLLRKDRERITAMPQNVKSYDVHDWVSDPLFLKLNAQKVRFDVSLSHDARQLAYFNHLAVHRLQRGLQLLSRYQVTVSDRLHAHILCTLLGIPHVTLDNSYGKVSKFMNTFNSDWSQARHASDLPEALHKAANLLSNIGDGTLQ